MPKRWYNQLSIKSDIEACIMKLTRPVVTFFKSEHWLRFYPILWANPTWSKAFKLRISCVNRFILLSSNLLDTTIYIMRLPSTKKSPQKFVIISWKKDMTLGQLVLYTRVHHLWISEVHQLGHWWIGEFMKKKSLFSAKYSSHFTSL